MSARVYSVKTDSTDKFTLFVFCNFLVLLSTTVSSQNIKKHIINIADENLTDYNFLCRYHYTKSKNYLKRRYRIRHWIPMFIGKPCTLPSSIAWPSYTIYIIWILQCYLKINGHLLMNNNFYLGGLEFG